MAGNNVILYVLSFIVLAILVYVGFNYAFVGKATDMFGILEEGNFSDGINKAYTDNTVYLWTPAHKTKVNGVAISGSVSGSGTVKAFLASGTSVYLINSFEVNGEPISFSNSCDETCNLPGLMSSKYILRFEISEGVTFNVQSVFYSSSKIEAVSVPVETFVPVEPVEPEVPVEQPTEPVELPVEPTVPAEPILTE